MTVGAMILSGGRSSRFGGIHKPGVKMGGRSVISRILGTVRQVTPAGPVWVVGPTDGLTGQEAASVVQVQESPPFSGPLAGIAAAVRGDGAVRGSGAARGESPGEPGVGTVLILAGDIPLISADHLAALVRASEAAGSPATSRDEQGYLQYLCAAWPAELLCSQVDDAGDCANKPVRVLFDGIAPVLVDVDAWSVTDFDTPEEFTAIRSGDR